MPTAARSERVTAARSLAIWHIVLAALTVSILALASVAARNYATTHKGPALDFVTFWAAGRLALAGHAAAAYDTKLIGALQHTVAAMAAGYFPFFYPPIAFLLFAPVALLPYGVAFAAFGFGQWSLLVVQLRRMLPAPWPLSSLVAAPAILVNFGIGQNGSLTAACLAYACWSIERRPGLAGAALGFLAIKPHIAVLVPVALVLGKQWRAASAACMIVAALVVASLLFGVRPWIEFLSASAQARGIVEQFAADWPKMISPFAALRLVGVGVPGAYAGQAACALIGLAGLVLCRRASGPWLIAVLASATLLLSPYLFDYDLPVSLIPIAAVAREAAVTGWRRGEKLVCAVVLFLPLFARLFALGLGVGIVPIVGLILFWVVVRRASKEAVLF